MFEAGKTRKSLCARAFAVAVLCVSASFASATQITDKLEIFTLPALGASWQSYTFENTYSSAPVVVCTGSAGPYPAFSPVVRLNNLTANSVSLMAQKFTFDANDTDGLHVGPVTCVAAATGTHDVTDINTGQTVFRFEAGTAVSNAGTSFNSGNMQPISTGLNGSNGVIGQVMSFNNAQPSVFHINDATNTGSCRARNTFPSLINGRFCIDNQNGSWPYGGTQKFSETLGYIVFESGGGAFETDFGQFTWSGNWTPRNIRAVRNSPPYANNTAEQLTHAVATQFSQYNGHPSWFSFYGDDPLAGSQIDGVVDEPEGLDRTHGNERIAYLGFGIPDVAVALTKLVSPEVTDLIETLSYTITVENTGGSNITLADLSFIDAVTQDATDLANLTPVLDATTDTDGDEILSVGEIWTFTASFDLSYTQFDNGNDVINTVKAVVGDYESEEASATTVLTRAPDVTLEKIHEFVTDTNSDGVADLGDVIRYRYRATNIGNVSLTDVELSDVHNGNGDAPLLTGEAITTDAAPLGDSTDTNLTDGIWGDLKPGDTVEFTAEYTVVQTDLDQL